MLITSIQLNNIAQTVYNLMTGAYDLKYFYSPYNEFITNELTDEGGKAFHTFTKIYNSIYALDQSGEAEKLSAEAYVIIEDIMDNLDHAQDLLCTSSFKRGYFDENDYSSSKYTLPIYENNLKRELQLPNGMGSYNYSKLVGDLDILRNMSDDTAPINPSAITELMDIQFSILTAMAYSYGQQLAKGNLPVWSNPELSYLDCKRARHKSSYSKSMLLKIYHNEIELSNIKAPHCSCCNEGLQDFTKCQQDLLKKLPENYHDDLVKMCFLHSLADASEYENAFIHGIKTGISIAVEALFEEE